MLLTAGARYAVRALAHIATKAEGRRVPSHEFAGPKGLPRRFLSKILGRLVQGRLLRSATGPHGGYRLAKPAKGMTLLEVVEAVEGPVRGSVPFEEAGPLDAILLALYDQAADLTRCLLKGVKFRCAAGWWFGVGQDGQNLTSLQVQGEREAWPAGLLTSLLPAA
jgi:Rrf2 family protein